MGENTNPEAYTEDSMSQEEHELVQELLPAFALGALDEEERGRVERHVRVCSRCQAELRSLEATAHLLAYTVPLYDPPAYLRESIRLLAVPRGPATVEPSSVAGRPTTAPPRRRLPGNPVTALLLLLSLVTVGLLSWNIHLKGQLNALQDESVDAHELGELIIEYVETPEAYEFHPIEATDHRIQAHGVIIRDRVKGRFVLLAKGLPPLHSKGEKYIVWVLDGEGRAIPVQEFHCDEQGRAVLLFNVPTEGRDIVEIGISVADDVNTRVPIRPILDGKLR